MQVHLLVQGYEVQEIIEQGYKATTDEQGKKNIENYAKAKDLVISGLTQIFYVKALWDKLQNIYAGDLKVKEAKLQIYRGQFEQLRMK